MSIPFIILCILYLIGCVGLMTIILLQKKRASGVGSIAGMGNTDTYWDKNKGRTLEGTLEKWTKLGGVAILLLTIVICLL